MQFALSRRQPSELLSRRATNTLFKAMANPLDPLTVVAFAATCRTIRDAVTEAPHGGESELCTGRARALCRRAGASCGEALVTELLWWKSKGLTSDDALAVTTLVLPFT